MALSLLVASGSWAGFILTRTVLDPGRSERLADQLFENETVRGVIVDRLADAVESRIPAGSPEVPREIIETGVNDTLDDPRVEQVIRDGFVRVHQNALNGIDEPVALDGTTLGQVGREYVVGVEPSLDAVLPAAPELAVELPTTGLSWLGTVKDRVEQFTLISAIVAITGILLAFFLARNRAAALRRVAYWAFAASAFWLLVAYGLPWILERSFPASASIAMAAIDVFIGAMVRPALTLAGFGLVLLVIGMAWPAIARRRTADGLGRAGRNGPPGAIGANNGRILEPVPGQTPVRPTSSWSAGNAAPVGARGDAGVVAPAAAGAGMAAAGAGAGAGVGAGYGAPDGALWSGGGSDWSAGADDPTQQWPGDQGAGTWGQQAPASPTSPAADPGWTQAATPATPAAGGTYSTEHAWPSADDQRTQAAPWLDDPAGQGGYQPHDPAAGHGQAEGGYDAGRTVRWDEHAGLDAGLDHEYEAKTRRMDDGAGHDGEWFDGDDGDYPDNFPTRRAR